MSTVETEKGVEAPAATPPEPKSDRTCTIVDVVLRGLLLAASIVAVVLLATSKQTEVVPVPGVGLTPKPAKFSDSPAFIYFLVAISVAGLYSIITLLASLSFLSKPNVPPKVYLILIAHDVLILGIVAAATGAAGGVAYIGLKGNTHVNWAKICHVYDKFCRYTGTSILISLFAGVLLVILIILNAISLYKRLPGVTSVF